MTQTDPTTEVIFSSDDCGPLVEEGYDVELWLTPDGAPECIVVLDQERHMMVEMPVDVAVLMAQAILAKATARPMKMN